MVPPAPERFSTIADCPHTDCRCAASRRPITSVEPPAAAGTISLTVSVGRQSPAPRLERGTIAAVVNAAAPVNTRRRDSNRVVTIFLPAGLLFCARRVGSAADESKRAIARSLMRALRPLVEAEQLEQR